MTHDDLDLVWRALASPHRRRILDLLRERPRTTGELEEALGENRFLVIQHLNLLREADLVTVEADGRRRINHLNPVPIRLVHDRWIRKYQLPVVARMANLKHQLEGTAMNAPMHVYEVYIRTTPEALWKAITDPEMTRQYFYGTAVRSTWAKGATVEHLGENGVVMLTGVYGVASLDLTISGDTAISVMPLSRLAMISAPNSTPSTVPQTVVVNQTPKPTARQVRMSGGRAQGVMVFENGQLYVE